MFTTLQSKKKVIAVLFFGVFISLLCASFYIQQKKAAFVNEAQLKIAEQKTTLASVALLVSKDGADAVVEKIIKDCSSENRARFDAQLSNLQKLRGAELVEMGQLFNACGNFFAVREAVMSARLEREFQVYKDLIEIVAKVDVKNVEDETYALADWEKLVLLEENRSNLSLKLVEIQGKIITDLRNNISINSDEMELVLVDGQKTKESLSALAVEITVLRQKVLNL